MTPHRRASRPEPLAHADQDCSHSHSGTPSVLCFGHADPNDAWQAPHSGGPEVSLRSIPS